MPRANKKLTPMGRDTLKVQPKKVEVEVIGGNAIGLLKDCVERVENLMKEREALGEDIRDIINEAKSAGLHVPTIREVIKRRRMDAVKRQQLDEYRDLYEGALVGKTDEDEE